MSYRNATLRPLLTATDEQRLARVLEAGRAAKERQENGRPLVGDDRLIRAGEQARQEFIESNVRLAINVASKMAAPGHLDRQDMIQDGMLGLERAVDKFDWRKGYKFSTYATWWIRQRVQRGMENTASTIRIPAHRASELHGALRSVDGDFDQLTDDHAELAARSSLISLDKPMGHEGDGSVGDTILADHGNPEHDVIREATRTEIRRLLDELDGESRDAVVLRFGVDGEEPMTYAAIGRELGVGTEVARRRVMRALESLRGQARPLIAA